MSPKSGAIFERKHIENYLQSVGKDPINDEPLVIEDLVPIRSRVPDIVPPRPPKFASIPSLLAEFQNEWDALAVEVFTLRKQLHKAREELSAAVYYKEAATRVAAQAIRERDEVKNALEELSTSVGQGKVTNGQSEIKNHHEDSTHVENGTEDLPGLPTKEISEAREELFILHKKQKPTLPVASDLVISVKTTSTIGQPFKKFAQFYLNSTNQTLYVGSTTGAVACYDLTVEGKLTPQKITRKGTITALGEVEKGNEPIPLIAFKDKLYLGKGKEVFPNQDDILGIVTHPKLRNLFILLSKNAWSLNDTENNKKLFDMELEHSILCGAFHIDGALFGVGTNEGNVIIYDLITGEAVTKVQLKYDRVDKIVFGPYWLFIASSNADLSSSLEIFDLRKNANVHNFIFENRVLDFTIDPSCSVIITYDSTNTLSVHRYIKKGKKWEKDLSHFELEPNVRLSRLQTLTTAENDSFISDGEVKLIGIADNTSIVEYKLMYT